MYNFSRFCGAFLALWLLLSAGFIAQPVHANTKTHAHYHNDALGSPIAATGPTGNLLWRESYRPYGERFTNQPAGATNPIWYTGKRQDPETGLVYMGARYYNPALGRFLSIDPVGPDESSLHSLNRYAYANNNPYRFTDPDGNIPVETLWDAGNVIYDLGKAAYGAATNNPALVAQGLGDAAADTLAMLTPYVPAGSTKVARMAAEKAGGGAKRTKPDFIVSRDGAVVHNSPQKVRASLEGAGFPGKKVSNASGTESGTLHNIPGMKMDARVMGGGPNHPARVVTARQGTSQPVNPSNGANFGNVPKGEQRARSHIVLP